MMLLFIKCKQKFGKRERGDAGEIASNMREGCKKESAGKSTSNMRKGCEKDKEKQMIKNNLLT